MGRRQLRGRLEAIERSSFSLVLFLEHVPQTLGAWLGEARNAAWQKRGGQSPYLWVEDELWRGTKFMSARGMVHFDAHFSNLLTDGRQVYFADFGLALSRDFELSAEEGAFLADHLVYDRCYAPGHLLRHHLPDSVRGGADHGTFLREWVAGHRPSGVPEDICAIIRRHARHAIVLDDFHHRLITQSKAPPSPQSRSSER